MKQLNLKKTGILRAPLAALIAVVGVGVVLAAGPASAQSNATMAVSGEVTDNCIIATTAMTFGAYDPIVTNLTTPRDSTAGKVTVTCTTGAVATIGLDLGLNGPAATTAGLTTRAMVSGANVLSYEIYKASDHAVVWTNVTTGRLTVAAAPSGTARDFTTFGRIPAGQVVPSASNYADTITAYVTF